MIFQGKARYPVREAVLHCAAINTGQFDGMSAFQVFAVVNKLHIERGFNRGFGYHGLIMPDGSFYPGRPLDMIGAHVIGHNAGTLGFLLIESRKIEPPKSVHDEKRWLAERQFSDWFTPQQAATLRFKLAGIPGLQRVSGHNDYASKLCPGFKVRSHDWL